MNKIETKKQRIASDKKLIVAIDIGKGTDIGCCRCPSGKDIKPFEFTYNFEGLRKFWDRICWEKTLNHLEGVVIGFESTGAYWEPLVHYLRKSR